uniref:GAG-pre-integrase domain-containing protein n=1 Tax=Lactuca sativa TaxID=4236 RepID=A0A9R1VY32_LACSA|nr:hypothetical protein LSAT_V11C400204210 [Lactuca sativa]
MDGHSKDGCFKKMGYRDWWPGKKVKPKPKAACVEAGPSPISGITDELYRLFVKHFKDESISEMGPKANLASRERIYDGWVVDTCATEHVTHRDDFLTNKVVHGNQIPITIPNGDKIPIMGEGEHTLPRGLKIDGVLHVLNFNYNLLYVHKLAKKLHCAITFFPDFFVMHKLVTRDLIGVCNCIGGLYRMGTMERKAFATTFEVWHKRLDHPSSNKISNLDFIKNVPSSSKIEVCDACFKAKHTRLPFPISEIKIASCFDLIHCECVGEV